MDIFNDEMPTFFLKQFTITSAPNLHLAACLRSLSIEVFNGKGMPLCRVLMCLLKFTVSLEMVRSLKLK